MGFDQILTSIEHPHALGSFRNWVTLLKDSEYIEHRYILRVMFICLSTFLTSPLRIYENVRYKEVFKGVTIDPEPIFIIGHWRSGSSHLHNLLCQDPNLGYVSTFQAMAPGFSTVGDWLIKPTLSVALILIPARKVILSFCFHLALIIFLPYCDINLIATLQFVL